MNHISLFSGIGGFDLAVEWMGWNNIAHCEWNTFCQKVLKYHFPNSIQHHDITKTDFSVYRGTIDIVTGGFPCQPYSVAGEQKGTEDERHLWPEMLRAIREIQPRFVVGENVPGLVSWSNGVVFEQVQSDLEAEGYEVTPFLLPASGVNAPHQRERIWFIAHSRSKQFQNRSSIRNPQNTEKKGTGLDNRPERSGNLRDVTDSNKFDGDISGFRASEISQQQASGVLKNNDSDAREGLENDNISPSWINANTNSDQRCKGGSSQEGCQKAGGYISTQHSRNVKSAWENFPTQSPVCNGNDGLSSELDGITFPKWRNESIKAGGNAIVPQVALQIFKAIQEFDLLQK